MPEIIARNPQILLFFLTLAVIEWVWRAKIAQRGYDVGAGAASLGVAIGQFAIKPLTAGFVTAIYSTGYALAPVKLPFGDWRIWALAFVAVEFAYYWFHRWSHTVNWMWATHAVHHSANEMTLPAAIRLGWTGTLSGGWLVFLPLVLIGFAPAMVVTLLAANLIYQYGLHTEVVGRLWRPIEWLFNTPSHHRAHHASDAAFLDCNFGGVLIVFDRLFGSFREEPVSGGLRYGLTTPIVSCNPLRIAFHQWFVMARAFAAAQSWGRRAEVLFGRPDALDPKVSAARTAAP